jgi:hypothetical protein
MAMKTFDCVGVSTSPAGEVKYRVANGSAARTKHLKQVGHTDVMLFDTPRPMVKTDAIDWFRENHPHLALDSKPAATAAEVAVPRMAAFDAEMARLMEECPNIYDEAVEAVAEEVAEEAVEEVALPEEAVEEVAEEEAAEAAPKTNKRKRKR